MYVNCDVPIERISEVQERLMCNALRLANKLQEIGIYVTAVNMAKTKTIYIFGTNFRLRIANHKPRLKHRNIKKLTIELDRSVILDDDFDEYCLDYATDIALEIGKHTGG